MDPFKSHLINLLALYEAGPPTSPLPTYDGPSDEATDTILKLLGNLTKRMYDVGLKNVAFPSIGDLTSASSLEPETQGDLPRQQLGNGDIRSLALANSTRRSSSLQGNDSAFAQASTVSQIASLTAPHLHLPPSVPTPDFPLILPMGPFAAAAFESGMSTVEEMRMLKAQLGDIARVCSAVARGDLGQKITVPVRGVVMSQLKDVINGMVDKLGQFAQEVARVGQEVETDGKFRVEVLVLDFEGTWRELVGVVKKLAEHTISQI